MSQGQENLQSAAEAELRNIIVHQAAQLLDRERQVGTLQGLLRDAQEQLGKAAAEIERLGNTAPKREPSPGDALEMTVRDLA